MKWLWQLWFFCTIIMYHGKYLHQYRQKYICQLSRTCSKMLLRGTVLLQHQWQSLGQTIHPFPSLLNQRHDNPSYSVPDYMDQYGLQSSYNSVAREIWSAVKTIHWPLEYTCCTWLLNVSNTFLSVIKPSSRGQGSNNRQLSTYINICSNLT
jgi:hypothetical protein